MDANTYKEFRQLLDQLAKQIETLYIGNTDTKTEMARLLKVFHALQHRITDFWVDHFAIIEKSIDDDVLASELALRDKAILDLQKEIIRIKSQTASHPIPDPSPAPPPFPMPINEDETDFPFFTDPISEPISEPVRVPEPKPAPSPLQVPLSDPAPAPLPEPIRDPLLAPFPDSLPDNLPDDLPAPDIMPPLQDPLPTPVSTPKPKIRKPEPLEPKVQEPIAPEPQTVQTPPVTTRPTLIWSQPITTPTPQKATPRDPAPTPAQTASKPQTTMADNLFSRLNRGDLEKSINLNDSYLFRRSLFDNDDALYHSVIKDLGEKRDMNEVMQYLGSYFPDWDLTSDSVTRLLNLLQQRFDLNL